MQASSIISASLCVAWCVMGGYTMAGIASPAPAGTRIPEAELTEWIDLFAGNDFSQWTRTDGSEVSSGWLGGWRIEGGVVERHGLLAGNIATKEIYSDFELEFEWKISKKGNSGVIYRQRDGKGLEYQILDDQRHSDGKVPSHRAASLYDLAAAARDKPSLPAGIWNQGRIVICGPVLEHWLNGERVIRIDMDSPEWARRVATSKFEGWADFGREASPILLQDHLDTVWFRKVRIREIQDSK